MNGFTYTTAMKYFGYGMVVVYFFMGIYVILSDKIPYLSNPYKLIFGLLCIAYALLRGYRVYKSITNEEE